MFSGCLRCGLDANHPNFECELQSAVVKSENRAPGAEPRAMSAKRPQADLTLWVRARPLWHRNLRSLIAPQLPVGILGVVFVKAVALPRQQLDSTELYGLAE